MTISLFTSLAIIISSGVLAQNPLCSQTSALQKKIPPQTEAKSCLDPKTSQRSRPSKPVTHKATDLQARKHTSASPSGINTPLFIVTIECPPVKKAHIGVRVKRFTLRLEQQGLGPFSGDRLSLFGGSILHRKISFSLGDVCLMQFLGIYACSPARDTVCIRV